MTLGMVKNVIGLVRGELMFYEDSDVEIINGNTGAHYRKDKKGRMTLGGDVLDASEEWILGLPVEGIRARGNNLIITVDG